MAITKEGGRQYPLVAKVSFGLADLTEAAAEAAMTLPVGASVIAASITFTTAFDAATSAVLDVTGAGITLNNADGKILGTTEASAIDSTALTVETDISVQIDSVGTNTVGAGFVLVEYVIDARANEVQPV